MLQSFTVNNFKNFKNDLTIDFSDINGYQFSKDCITDDFIGKMLIYGKNGTGKTNLGRAICDIHYTLNPSAALIPSLSFIKNADNDNDITSFSYSFTFNGKKDHAVYSYQKHNREILKSEKLIVNDHVLFDIDYDQKRIDLDSSIHIDTDRFINNNNNSKTIPFLEWLVLTAIVDKNSIVYRIYNFALKIININTPNTIQMNRSLVDMLEKDNDGLQKFLNYMGIACKLSIEKLPDGSKQLYFVFDNQKVEFLENASSGTLTLFNFYVRFILPHKECSLLYFDEFDAYFHYELSEKVFRYLKEEFKDSLVILTTHNTGLMTNRICRPDCLFILTTGQRMIPLCKATNRELREGHNLSKLYMNGEFDED